MEKPAKRESCMIIIAAVLVFFAWISRFINHPLMSGSNLVRSVIYPALLIFWGFTLHHRLIHPQVRHLAVSIAVLMLIWFLMRTIKYSIPEESADLIRYFWYLFYLPMLFTPTLAVLTSLSIGLPESERLPRKYNILWFIAAALFLLVISNDLHQLVFEFPDDVTPWTDKDYHYAAGYYLYAVYVAVCNISTFAIMVMKTRRPGKRRWMLLPCIPIFLLLLYWFLYITGRPKGWIHVLFGDLTAVSCVLYASAFELCIRCGLIRSNSGYRELFRAGQLGAQIADEKYTVCLSSNNAGNLTEAQIIRASEHPVMISHTVRLKSKPIQFGSVLWREDVSELTEAIEEYEENCRDLAEQNRIDRENLEGRRTLLSLQEKNRAVDLLQRQTAVQLDQIERLLTRYDSEKDETGRRRLLAGAAVLGAYIKRYGNLLLVSEGSEEADIADLIRCFEESFRSLQLLNADGLCSLPADRLLKTKDMLRIYRSFEAILETCLFEVQHVWVNGREQGKEMILNMEFVSAADLSQHAQEADGFSADAGTFRFSFRVQKGGVQA